MIEQNEIPYLITLAHNSKLRIEQINSLLVKIIHEKQSTLETFFQYSEEALSAEYGLDDKYLEGIRAAKSELPNSSFIAEDLYAQGFEAIPIYSAEYSPSLKSNLKGKSSPPILYVKGNKNILQEDSIAVVGSRNASEISLQFTDRIANIASEKYEVVVSGFAKGVDKQALDSALKYKGHSIIVLPQGIMTFESGINKYYTQIIEGDVLVASTFIPRASWSVQLAMGRNPYIYGLAKKIIVAESGARGGTWSGVIDGLRKGRTIYVRQPESDEANANLTLIEKGAIPVDCNGNEIARPAASVRAGETSPEIPGKVIIGHNSKKPGKDKEKPKPLSCEDAPELPLRE